MEGAGGIGGLLMVQEGGATYAARYDANGNLVGFYNLTDDNIALRVEYGPYGQLLTSRGYYTSCPFRFSTKYQDQETGLLYFGYRYYNPETGRWVSRDPVGEVGGAALYGYVNNTPISYLDPLGLQQYGYPPSYDQKLWMTTRQ